MQAWQGTERRWVASDRADYVALSYFSKGREYFSEPSAPTLHLSGP